jgi:hypothetical protein
MSNAQVQTPEVEDPPICAAVARDLHLSVAELLAPRKPWSFEEFDADVRRRLGLRPPGSDGLAD